MTADKRPRHQNAIIGIVAAAGILFAAIAMLLPIVGFTAHAIEPLPANQVQAAWGMFIFSVFAATGLLILAGALAFECWEIDEHLASDGTLTMEQP